MDQFRQDSLQMLSDRLQQLSDISSRFDALTKETEGKLHNVIETANVLQQKMSPINEQMESLRAKRKGYDSCRLFLKQTSSYQDTTEKYIQELKQSKISNVEDYVASLVKAKESLDFFATYLPQEKNAENLQYIITEGSKGLRDKFKELLTSITYSERLQPDKCLSLAGVGAVNLKEFLPKFSEKQLQELRIITDWLDSQGKTAEYSQVYVEVRSLSLCSSLKKFRDSLTGTVSTTFGTSPLLARRGGPRDTPSKVATLQRKMKSRPTALTQQPALFDSVDQSDLDADDVNAMLTAFLRMAMLESLTLPLFGFKFDRPQQLVDQIVAKAKENMFEDVHSFEASVRREFKQDPESLLRLVAVLDRLRHLRPDLSAASCPPAFKAGLEDLAKDMQTQARSSLEDFRDEIVKDGGGAGGGSGSGGGGGSAGPGGGIVGGGSGGASDLGVLAEVAGGRSLPPDGTVHELTLKVLKFLQQLHDFGDTAHEILAREVILGRQQQQHGGRQQQQQQQQKEKDKVLGAYLSQTLANLLRTLDSRAEHYSDPALRAIFLLNNYRYVQNRLERDKMTATVQAYNYEAIKFFEEHQNKNRQSYLNRGLQKCAAALELGGEVASVAAAAAASAAQPTVGNSSSGHSDGHSRRFGVGANSKHASVVVKVCRCQSISCFFIYLVLAQ
ncbi:hypothetical protein BOX15_Mlig013628g1 [Macrostomum lignano]|uniref:Exocyst complex component 7 n=1 Tax=Macrostomum lignano TaxID=282301 RepID=A0A267E998_9PLAT|nr:hypothetical protein BOX15_Mlig013628g1 [Macrostomum lignano]